VREALAAGRDVVLRTDIQGARYIRSAVPGAFTVFVSPPSRAELERRLREREADSEEQIALRLKTAEEELAAAEEFDARVVNDDLEACARRVLALIEQERARPGRPPPRV
jgi:guanylate kinase